MSIFEIESSLNTIERLIPADENGLAVAVSGGSDSMALLHVLSDWCRSREISLCVLSVNHGLRSAAAEECRFVERYAIQLGHEHCTLNWKQTAATGNLQGAAREGRYRLMSAWANSRGISNVALGHTMDDQAETVLLNLSRGAGVDGLSAMPFKVSRYGVNWLRPFLGLRRDWLREQLVDRGVVWIEDPTNEDTRYDRVKARKILRASASLGIGVKGLARTAAHMQEARHVLEEITYKAAKRLVSVSPVGEYVVSGEFFALRKEIAGRLLSRLVKFASGDSYRRRYSALNNSLAALERDGIATISNCILLVTDDGNFRLVPDVSRCEDPVPATELWNGRWKVAGLADSSDCTVGVLGEGGLHMLGGRQDRTISRRGLLASPAVWRGDRLLAALGSESTAQCSFADMKGEKEFLRSLLCD